MLPAAAISYKAVSRQRPNLLIHPPLLPSLCLPNARQVHQFKGCQSAPYIAAPPPLPLSPSLYNGVVKLSRWLNKERGKCFNKQSVIRALSLTFFSISQFYKQTHIYFLNCSIFIPPVDRGRLYNLERKRIASCLKILSVQCRLTRSFHISKRRLQINNISFAFVTFSIRFLFSI